MFLAFALKWLDIVGLIPLAIYFPTTDFDVSLYQK